MTADFTTPYQRMFERALKYYQPVLSQALDQLPASALPPGGQDGTGGYPPSDHDHDDRYYTKTETDDAITDAIAEHEDATDPHPQYQTQTESDGRYLQLSSVSLTPAANIVPRAGVAGKLATGWIPAVLLDSMVSGTLPIANGGTGATTAAAALTALGGIQNAGSAPSIQAGLDSALPAAGGAGRLYLATDSLRIYRDNGTNWVIIASVQLADQSGTLSDAQHGSRSGGSLHALASGSAAGFMSAADFSKLAGIAAGAQPGTVTSVDLSMPTLFSVSGAPITTSGTIAVSLQTQSANQFLGGPTSGAAAAPTFRTIAAADVPNLDAAKITSGILPAANGGTGIANTGKLTVSADTTLSGGGTVKLDGASNGQLLAYNSTNSRYEPTAFSGVLNAGNSVSIQSGLEIGRPTVGTSGRFFVSTDGRRIYRDSGSAWVMVGTVNWSDLQGTPLSFTPSAHASSHQSGGSDALDLGSLAGTLTDAQHGSRSGGSLHALASGSAAGFMSASDFSKLSGITAGAAVASVGASAPLSSSGGTAPTISLQTQSANQVLAGPITGSAAAPGFRALVAGDLPLTIARLDQAQTFTAAQTIQRTTSGYGLSVNADAAADAAALKLQLAGVVGGTSGAAEVSMFDGAAANAGSLVLTAGLSPATNRYFGFLARKDRDGTRLPIKFFTMNTSDVLTEALAVGSGANAGRVGIVQSSPAYPLDVTGDINTTTRLRVNGTQVVGARGTAITAPAATVADCQRAINDIISRLQAHGLIS